MRTVYSKDIDLIHQIEKEIFEYNYYSKEYKKDSHWWITWDGEDIAGFAGLTFYPNIKKPAAFLCASGVYKEYRGNGLQRKYIKLREKFALKWGYTRIITYT